MASVVFYFQVHQPFRLKRYTVFDSSHFYFDTDKNRQICLKVADKCYRLFERDPQHPSLHLKKVGKYWSVRVGRSHRAPATEIENGFIWIWIGTHEEYERLIRS